MSNGYATDDGYAGQYEALPSHYNTADTDGPLIWGEDALKEFYQGVNDTLELHGITLLMPVVSTCSEVESYDPYQVGVDNCLAELKARQLID